MDPLNEDPERVVRTNLLSTMSCEQADPENQDLQTGVSFHMNKELSFELTREALRWGGLAGRRPFGLAFSSCELRTCPLRDQFRAKQTIAYRAKPARRAKFGGGRRDRTDDLMLAKHALSQLSYAPIFSLASAALRGARHKA